MISSILLHKNAGQITEITINEGEKKKTEKNNNKLKMYVYISKRSVPSLWSFGKFYNIYFALARNHFPRFIYPMKVMSYCQIHISLHKDLKGLTNWMQTIQKSLQTPMNYKVSSRVNHRGYSDLIQWFIIEV